MLSQVVYDCKFMIILRMTLPIKLSLIMQTHSRGILKKLDTERNTLNFNHSDCQHIEYKHFFSNYLLTNRSECFLGTIWRNSQNLFALVGLERISKNHPNLEIKEITVSCCNCFMWWYEINCSEILWVHTIYLHMSCKYASL